MKIMSKQRKNKAFLILEDGTVFEGKHIGADKEVISEIVFNTTMAGYTEVFTDPSYAGQAVCMTYPLIGNYGYNKEDMESERIWIDALIIRELSGLDSNFRSEGKLETFLKEYGIPGIEGIDTRALTRRLRDKGTMNGCITTDENYDLGKIIERCKEYTIGDVVSKVTCTEKYVVSPKDVEIEEAAAGRYTVNDGYANHIPENETIISVGKKVALLDFGVKQNIIRSLARRGMEVTVFPAHTSAKEILEGGFDGIMLSNGPGDPKTNTDIIENIKVLFDSEIPIFAICLGHQLMALATGGDTYKLKYGHRGGNHPVKDLKTGRVYISSQNHGYCVDTDKLDKDKAVPAFVNVNDGTNEGIEYINKNVFTVQFHPEASPGPKDPAVLFDRFLEMMGGEKNA